jgi:transcription termination factor Rho
MREMKLKELQQKSPTELLAFAEENDVENASTMRKQELMFAILKQLASVEVQIIGEGVVEILQSQVVFDPTRLRRATARNPDRIRIPRRKTARRNSRFWRPPAVPERAGRAAKGWICPVRQAIP